MKVVFCWWTFEGYFAACWRELAGRAGMELSILALAPDPQSLAPYDAAELDGLTVRLQSRGQLTDPDHLLKLIVAEKADVVVVPGIVNAAALAVMRRPELARVRVVMAWDTPWRSTWRQRLGRHVLIRRLARIDHVVVAGERAFQCVRRIGFPEHAITRGMYGIDAASLAPIARERLAQPAWPRAFGFVGRCVEEKGIADLAQAYAIYRREVSDPWPLITWGRGPLKHLLDQAGADDRGFLPPRRLHAELSNIGAFVLASHFDPWPLALVEACAAGLPIVCTEACGSAVELIRPHHNGLIVPTGDSAGLANALSWMHEHPADLPRMGQNSVTMAEPYSAARWADRWSALLTDSVRGAA